MFNGTNTQSKSIHINSADAFNYNAVGLQGEPLTTNFTILLNDGIDCRRDEMIILSLNSFQCPLSFYNVNQYNNTFWVHFQNLITPVPPTVYRQISIPVGNYNIQTLLIQMNESIKAEIINWGGASAGDIKLNCSFIKNKVKVLLALDTDIATYAGNNGLEIEIQFRKYRQDSLGNILHPPTTAGFNKLCGFLWTEQEDPAGISPDFYVFSLNSPVETFIESPNVVNMNPIPSLYLRTNISTGNVLDSKNGVGNTLQKVEIKQNQNNYAYFEASNGRHKTLLQRPEIRRIDVRLTDDEARPVDLNGLDWDFTLFVEVIKRVREGIDYTTSNLREPSNSEGIRNQMLKNNYVDRSFESDPVLAQQQLINHTRKGNKTNKMAVIEGYEDKETKRKTLKEDLLRQLAEFDKE